MSEAVNAWARAAGLFPSTGDGWEVVCGRMPFISLDFWTCPNTGGRWHATDAGGAIKSYSCVLSFGLICDTYSTHIWHCVAVESVSNVISVIFPLVLFLSMKTLTCQFIWSCSLKLYLLLNPRGRDQIGLVSDLLLTIYKLIAVGLRLTTCVDL